MIRGSLGGYSISYRDVVRTVGSPWVSPYRRLSSSVQDTDKNASAASYLDRIEHGEVSLEELDHLAHDASRKIDDVSGSTVANLLGILALAHHWDAEVFSKAFHRSNLRTKYVEISLKQLEDKKSMNDPPNTWCTGSLDSWIKFYCIM